jgi:hypothetical protein
MQETLPRLTMIHLQTLGACNCMVSVCFQWNVRKVLNARVEGFKGRR